MDKQKFLNKINVIDAAVAIILLIIGSVAVYSIWFYNPQEPSKTVDIVVKTPAENIQSAATQDHLVYFNGVNKQVTVKKVTVSGADLLITLAAPGMIEGPVYEFNGQRVLINQKAEIRASYFAQGRITSISYEN